MTAPSSGLTIRTIAAWRAGHKAHTGQADGLAAQQGRDRLPGQRFVTALPCSKGIGEAAGWRGPSNMGSFLAIGRQARWGEAPVHRRGPNRPVRKGAGVGGAADRPEKPGGRFPRRGLRFSTPLQ